jgi:hypothetical protein
MKPWLTAVRRPTAAPPLARSLATIDLAALLRALAIW